MPSTDNNFYVYRYNRPDGTPYYIGKKRKPFSAEALANMSASRIGKNLGPRSEETKAKMSATRAARKAANQIETKDNHD